MIMRGGLGVAGWPMYLLASLVLQMQVSSGDLETTAFDG